MDDNQEIDRKFFSMFRKISDGTPIFKFYRLAKGINKDTLKSQFDRTIRFDDIEAGKMYLDREQLDFLIQEYGIEIKHFFEPVKYRVKTNAEYFGCKEE